MGLVGGGLFQSTTCYSDLRLGRESYERPR